MRKMIFFGHPDKPCQDYVDRLRQIVDRTNRYLLLIMLSIGLVWSGVLLPGISDINKYKNKKAELSGRESDAEADWRERLCALKTDGLDLHFINTGSCTFKFPKASVLQNVDTNDTQLKARLGVIISEITEFHSQKSKDNADLEQLGRTQESLSIFDQSFSLPIALVPVLLSGLAFLTAIIVFYAREAVVDGCLNAIKTFKSLDTYPRRRDWLGRSPFWLQPVSRSSARERYFLLSAMGTAGHKHRIISSLLTAGIFCLASVVIVTSFQIQLIFVGNGASRWLDDIMDLPTIVRRALLYVHPLLFLGVLLIAFHIFAVPLTTARSRPSELRRDVLRGMGGCGAVLAASFLAWWVDPRPEFAKYQRAERHEKGRVQETRAKVTAGDVGKIKYQVDSGSPGLFFRMVTDGGEIRRGVVDVNVDNLDEVKTAYRTRVAEALALEKMNQGQEDAALAMLKKGLSLDMQDRRLLHLAARIIRKGSGSVAVDALDKFAASIGKELPATMVEELENTKGRWVRAQDPKKQQATWKLPYLDGKEHEYKIQT